MISPPSAHLSYRYDLDGLRGIAITLVVIFHVFVGRVSGGVDIFLLLSGYFFLGSQLRYIARPQASLNPWWPLWRTLRRLFPALTLTLLVTWGLATALTPQLLTGEFYAQLGASLGYIQNIELANQQADYAAASPETSPLQHLWSMSVQGQFYLVAIALALLLAVLGRACRRPELLISRLGSAILLAATIASFCYAARWGLIGTPGNYYDFFARAWEMTLGGLLALMTPLFARLRLPTWLATGYCILGLGLILSAGLVISNTLAFPGPLTLYPLSGAILIILSGGVSNPMSRLLASRPARWLGEIAYSLYLWHWPLLILATAYLWQPRPAWWLGLGIVTASLGLAWGTHRIVEKPLRQHRNRPVAGESVLRAAWRGLKERRPARWRALGGVMVAAAAIVVATQLPLYLVQVDRAAAETEKGFNAELYPGALVAAGYAVPEAPYRPDPRLMGDVFPAPGHDGCIVAKDAPADVFARTTYDDAPCVYGDPTATTTVVLAGGSHAEQWITPLDSLGQEHGFKVVPYLRQECPLELGDALTVTSDCAQWSARATEEIIELAPVAVVSTSTRPVDEVGRGPDYVPAGYLAFWQALASADISLLGLRDNPWGFDYATAENPPLDLTMCLAALEDPHSCGMDREHVYAATDPASQYREQFPTFDFVDTAHWFCSPTRCEAVRGNVVIYRDQNHISNAFAATANDLIWPHLVQLLN